MSWYENAARDPTIGPIVPHGKRVVRARGYSLLELEGAGLSRADAERLGIPVEAERNSSIGTNVMQLVSFGRIGTVDVGPGVNIPSGAPGGQGARK